MSTTAKIRQVIQSGSGIVGGVISYISDAVARIFSPSDDQYPSTGVQPFEGDPADKKGHWFRWIVTAEHLSKYGLEGITN